jgi:D-alanyl-lipoteichoic acid acyltransferase DltB (MBOAT superfamily)
MWDAQPVRPMLFNSYAFIFAFAPITFIGFFALARVDHEYAIVWIAAASLVFYAWWDVRFLALLVPSIGLNYLAGVALVRHRARPVLWLAVAANLAALLFFKYWTFALGVVQSATGLDFAIRQVLLPIGISFFTFTQIAFLVDAYRGEAKEYNFFHYLFL